MITTPYVKFILNSEAEIVDFECHISEVKYTPEEVIGKNWFDVFIHESDKKQVMKVFQELFDGKEKEWETFKNDIICKNDQHKLIDFHNQVFERDGVKYINSVGIEHAGSQDNESFKYLSSNGIKTFVDQNNKLLKLAEELAE